MKTTAMIRKTRTADNRSMTHNDRSGKDIKKTSHIDHDKTCDNNIIIPTQNIDDFYEKYFRKSLNEFNKRTHHKQKTMDDLKKQVGAKPYLEFIIQFGNKDDIGINSDGVYRETAREMLIDTLFRFKEKYPQLHIVGAYIHMDEATPHLHVDAIPVAVNCKRGLKIQPNFKQALIQMGYGSDTDTLHDNPTTRFSKDCDNILTEIMEEHGIERIKGQSKGQKHLETAEFKAQQIEIETALVINEFKYATIKCERQKANYERNKKILQAQEAERNRNDAFSPYLKLVGDHEELEYYRKITKDISELCQMLFPVELVNNLPHKKKELVEKLNHALTCLGKPFMYLKLPHKEIENPCHDYEPDR